jgi:hypothetical protein
MRKMEKKLDTLVKRLEKQLGPTMHWMLHETVREALKETYLRGVKDGVDRMDAVIDQKIASKAIIDAIERDMADEA